MAISGAKQEPQNQPAPQKDVKSAAPLAKSAGSVENAYYLAINCKPHKAISDWVKKEVSAEFLAEHKVEMDMNSSELDNTGLHMTLLFVGPAMYAAYQAKKTDINAEINQLIAAEFKKVASQETYFELMPNAIAKQGVACLAMNLQENKIIVALSEAIRKMLFEKFQIKALGTLINMHLTIGWRTKGELSAAFLQALNARFSDAKLQGTRIPFNPELRLLNKEGVRFAIVDKDKLGDDGVFRPAARLHTVTSYGLPVKVSVLTSSPAALFSASSAAPMASAAAADHQVLNPGSSAPTPK